MDLQVVPDARAHLDWQMVGTPLTHTHFRRRHHGCYGVKGPAQPGARGVDGSNSSSSSSSSFQQGAVMQPQAVLAMRGLYCCGDNTFPFVGTPAVAASGMWVANTLAPVWKHWAAANTVDP
jgi:phytoene dehydrogenase-like protein